MFESTSSITCVFVFDVKNSLSTICVGNPFYDAIFLINCRSWVSFECEQIVVKRHRRERIHAMRCFYGTKLSNRVY